MLSWIALVLALKSLWVALFRTKSFVDFALSALFAVLALRLPFNSDLVSISVTTLATLLIVNMQFSFIKIAFFSIFLVLSFGSISLDGLAQISREKPIGQLVITGLKDPGKVILQDHLGQPIGSYLMHGDYVTVRARVIRFHPALNFLGFSNVVILESIFNGYRTMERHNQLPHTGFSLSSTSSLLNWVWYQSFFLSRTWPLIEATTLESSSFPLSLQATYSLLVGPTGLSSKLLLE